jgi:hypothetical protein
MATQIPFALLWAAVFAAVLLWRHATPARRRVGLPTALLGAALAIGTAFALWPGGFLKISLLKIPALELYRLYLGREFAPVPGRLGASAAFLAPVLIAVFPAIVWLSSHRRSDSHRWGPFVVVGAVYGAGLLPFMLIPTYVLPAVCALVPVTGYVVDRLPTAFARRLVAVGAGMLALVAAPRMPLESQGDRDRADIEWVRAELGRRDVLADGGHIFQYYLGPRFRPRIRRLHVEYDGRSLSIRERGVYRPLQSADISGRTLVVLKQRAAFFGSGAEDALLEGGCAKVERPTFAAYRCPPR